MSDTAPVSIPVERRVVLVAADEDSTLGIVVQNIVRLGLEPMLMRDGAAAVEVATTCQRLLMCVLLDVQMPLMNGVDAAQRIQVVAPGIPLVLMSGVVSQMLAERLTQVRATILHKPFTRSQLRDTLLWAKCRARAADAVATKDQIRPMPIG